MKQGRSRPAFLGLRAQVALVALCLAALPWVGYRYVKEMERLLLAGQEQNLLATARAVATALHDRPQIMQLAPRNDESVRRQVEEELRRLEELRARAAATARGTPAGDTPPEQAPPPPEAPPPAVPAPPDARALPPALPASGASRDEIGEILRGLERSASRIRVIDRQQRVLSLTGSLKQSAAAAQPGIDEPLLRALRPLLGWIIRPPREDFEEPTVDDAPSAGREIENALRGLPGTRVRNTRDGRAVIVSAAHPIWAGDEVLGAVVVEETTNPILSLSNRALERLLLLTLAVFLLAGAVLAWFATRLSVRIRRLRDEAESAVDAEGRIARLVSGSTARDEIGDLSRSFSAILEKLGRYHGYLERLAGRLSHELRTPIVVVRSSLDNLKAQPLAPEARVYIERAEEGVGRLATILTRMSEATHLEQGLRTAERERYDLAAVIEGCVSGYRTAYPGEQFDWQRTEGPLFVKGAPDLAAQMLDKLVGNALDFRAPGTPVRIGIQALGGQAVLQVANQGPPIPEEIRDRLFGSMVSARSGRAGGEPHLGLGLYIVRLVAEFHGGTVGAENTAAPPGVVLTVSIPLA